MVLLMDYEIKQINNGWLLYGGKPDDKKVIFCKQLFIACDAIKAWATLGYNKALEIVIHANKEGI